MGDWFSDALNAIGDAVEDVVDAVVDVVEDVVDAVGDVVEDVVDAVGDVVEDVVDAAEDVAEWTLNTLDDVVFDTVDYITGGVIDIDYDDGQFSAGFDIGIASVGVSFGDQGFSAESSFDIGLASGEISYDSSDGLAMSGSIGVDWGPLPYADGHLSISPDGDVSIGGELQATLPFVDIDAGFNASMGRGADGTWGAAADLDLDVNTLHGDLSVDASSSVQVDAGGHITRDGNLDVSLDLDGDGENDLDDVDDGMDDLVAGGLFGGKGPGGLAEHLTPIDPVTGAPREAADGDDDIMTNLGKAADSYSDITQTTAMQGLESESTRPPADDGSDDGFDASFDDGLPDDGFAPVGAVGPVDDGFGAVGPVDDAFAPADDFAAVDTLIQPIDIPVADIPAPEPIPEPPPSDFAVEIDTIESVEVEADEMWDDLG